MVSCEIGPSTQPVKKMESSTKSLTKSDDEDQTAFVTGLILAIASSFFIGSSFIIKKLSLLRLNRKGSVRAGAGGFGYLKDWMWWLGLLTMGVGEAANFVAFAFAPASLVTPLGALSVLVSAVLASKFLDESLNVLGKLGCLLCILGSVMVIIHSPKEQEVGSLAELIEMLQDPVFLNYVFIVVITSFIIIFYLGPRYGSRHVLVYITLCSCVGSLTVMACKGLGLAISEMLTASRMSDLSKYLAFVFFAILVFCVCLQMNYLNKTLDLFSTSLVTPVYYVMFTTLVIVASAILFKEWGNMSFEDVLGTFSGFLVIISAIFLLQGFKDADVNFTGIRPLLLRNGSKSDYGSNVYLARTV